MKSLVDRLRPDAYLHVREEIQEAARRDMERLLESLHQEGIEVKPSNPTEPEEDEWLWEE